MKIIAMTVFMGIATITNAQTQEQTRTRTQAQAQAQHQNRERKASEPKPQNAEELAKQLDISQEEADKTWEIYTEYSTKKQATQEKRMAAMKEKRANKEEKADADYEKMFYDNLKSQREALDMDEAYFKKFNEILPAKKTMKLMRQSRMGKHHNKNGARKGMKEGAQKPEERNSN